MKYAEKIKYAEKVADQLLDEILLDKVKENLKEQGLFENDIANVVASARNIIGEKLKPIIRSKLLNGETINNATEFEKLDAHTLKKLVDQEIRSIKGEERKKVNELLKKGIEPENIFKEIRQEFYPKELFDQQIAAYDEVKKKNSGSGRLLNIGGGIGLILLGTVISFASMQGSGGGRFFYGLILVGLVMVVKGFMTAKTPYDY